MKYLGLLTVFFAATVISTANAATRPLVFEANAQVRGFSTQSGGMRLGLSERGARFELTDGSAVQLVALGGRRVMPTAEGARSTVNYYLGNQARAWRVGVSASSAVRQQNLWRGIDLLWYSRSGALEYDLVLAAGSDPSQIGFRTEGGVSKLLPDGTLATGKLRWKKPLAYQSIGGKRTSVAARYTLSKSGKIGFSLGRYDHSKPLTIDPVLISSSFLGGTGEENVYGVATDSTGAAYVMGITTSPGVTGRRDLFVSKISAAGALVYTTFIGGTDNDGASGLGGIAVDSGGSAYIASDTDSTNFPTTLGAFQPTSGGRTDAVLAKLNASGGLSWASYYGGTQDEHASGVAVNAAGQPAITGQSNSSDIPITPGAFQPSRNGIDCFVAKFPTGGNGILYATFLGGSDFDFASSLAFSPSGRLYITGATYSADFPGSTLGPLGRPDPFVAAFNSDNSVRYITRLGGSSSDQAKYGRSIAVDALDNVSAIGNTTSTDFPTASGFQLAYQGGASDGFAFQLGPNGSRNWATYIGGNGFDGASAISVDEAGFLYIVGFSNSNNFPLDGAFFTNPSGYVLRLTPSGVLAGSTFLDSQSAVAIATIPTAPGDVWVSGRTYSETMPTLNAFQPTFGGASDGFLSRVHFDAVDVEVTQTAAPLPYYSGDVATFTIQVTNNGPDTASSVVLTDTLSGTEAADPDNPATLSILSANSTRGTVGISGRVVTVNLGTMIPGATATIRVSARMTVTNANLAIFSRAVATVAPSDVRPLDNTSTTSLLTRVDNRPRISSLSPAAVAAGSPEFTLTINGRGFVPGAVVRLNGLLRTSTFVNENRLTATIRASDVASPGVARITVETPLGISPEALLIIGNPSLSLSATARVAPGGGWIVDVGVRNSGTAAALETRLTAATLGGRATISTLPQLIGEVGTSGVATVPLSFPASSGTSGSYVLLRISGTHALGTFGGTLRVLLP